MNIFKDAKLKEKIKKLPLEYNITKKGKITPIRSKDISSVKIKEQIYLISAFDLENTTITIFKDFTDFHLFVYDNFYKLDHIFCNRITISTEYHLKNGLLHKEDGKPAYIKYDKYSNIIEEKYFLFGKETDINTIKRLIRIKKFKRIVN